MAEHHEIAGAARGEPRSADCVGACVRISALDVQTERAVEEALEGLAEGRTVIVIAHRLSTVRDADQIVILDAGEIAERGTHDELLALGGRYAAMVARDGAPLPV